MSITITTDVFCDVCCNWQSDVPTTGPRPRIRAARRIAKERGWKFDGSNDICPDCLEHTRAPQRAESPEACIAAIGERDD